MDFYLNPVITTIIEQELMTTSKWRSRAGTTFQIEKRAALGSRGMVVTNHPLGSAAGSEMLLAGGNAIDAAIAALFALSVVEPMMVGIFGAGHMNLRLANGEHHVIDGYATAPAASTEDMYKPIAASGPDYLKSVGDASSLGYLSIGVPGNLKAWTEALETWGTLPLNQVMEPAIRFAARGFKASGYLSETVVQVKDVISRFSETASTYMPGGIALRPGELVDRSDYALTLQAIAEQGSDYLYNGPLGEIVCDLLPCRILRPIKLFVVIPLRLSTGDTSYLLRRLLRLRVFTSRKCSTSWKNLKWPKWGLAPLIQSIYYLSL